MFSFNNFYFTTLNQSTSTNPASFVFDDRKQNKPILAPIHLPGCAVKLLPMGLKLFPSTLVLKEQVPPLRTCTLKYISLAGISPITSVFSACPLSASLDIDHDSCTLFFFFVKPTYA